MPTHLFMTHADRAKRRATIIRALIAGETSGQIADRLKISRAYVNQIRRARGLDSKVGRPRKFDELPPEIVREYLQLRRHVGASEASRIMGLTL